jgi:hypothetical protein
LGSMVLGNDDSKQQWAMLIGIWRCMSKGMFL